MLDHVGEAGARGLEEVSNQRGKFMPDTFCATRLVQRGYALSKIIPLDLFPQTYYIESVTLLDRSSAA
jgi:hypothetical protein